jgi:two-component system phosphate regulon response regulator PhoB
MLRTHRQVRAEEQQMPATKILIVEDEAPIREMIAFHLGRAGYTTIEAENCRVARELLVDEQPDLALIDGMLPDMSGLELTRMLKRDRANDDLAIIMLTARADDFDKVTGLEGGADDYVTKPFSPRELVARIQAVLRRGSNAEGEVHIAGNLELDAARTISIIAATKLSSVSLLSVSVGSMSRHSGTSSGK